MKVRTGSQGDRGGILLLTLEYLGFGKHTRRRAWKVPCAIGLSFPTALSQGGGHYSEEVHPCKAPLPGGGKAEANYVTLVRQAW